MSWPVSEGDVYFEWNNKNPGDTLLTWVLPLLVLLMLTSVLLALSLVRKGLLKARLNDEKTFLLDKAAAFAISERRFRDVVETTTDWIWEADELLQLTWISVRFRRLPVTALMTGSAVRCGHFCHKTTRH
jgi:PAS domain-containing protein